MSLKLQNEFLTSFKKKKCQVNGDTNIPTNLNVQNKNMSLEATIIPDLSEEILITSLIFE